MSDTFVDSEEEQIDHYLPYVSDRYQYMDMSRLYIIVHGNMPEYVYPLTHMHTHARTHSHRERERERERDIHTHTHTSSSIHCMHIEFHMFSCFIFINLIPGVGRSK